MPKSEPMTKPAEKATPGTKGDSGGKGPGSRNAGNQPKKDKEATGDKTRPDRVGPPDRDKAPAEKTKADRQRADQERKAKETQQRVRETGTKGAGRAPRTGDHQRSLGVQKAGRGQIGKEAQEAARQRSATKDSAIKPEKAVSYQGAEKNKNGQGSKTKTQEQLEKLAKEIHGGKQPKASEFPNLEGATIKSVENDGAKKTVAEYKGKDGELNRVDIQTDRSGRTTIKNTTIRPGESATQTTREERNGIPIGRPKTRTLDLSRQPPTESRGVDSNRVYTAPDAFNAGATATKKSDRREEKSPKSAPDFRTEPTQKPSRPEVKTPRARPEYDREPRLEGRRSKASDGPRLFGNVPNDYVERSSDYSVDAEFERDEGAESGILTVTRGLDLVVAPAHSGFSGKKKGTAWNSAPAGKYEILDGGKERFRLEMQDSNYGNDEADVPGSGWGGFKDISAIRLHGPGSGGQSTACVTIGYANGDISPAAKSSWEAVKKLIDRGPTNKSTVERYKAHTTLGGLWGKETLNSYGTLTIRDGRRTTKVHSREPEEQ
jgi:hypothetical protein